MSEMTGKEPMMPKQQQGESNENSPVLPGVIQQEHQWEERVRDEGVLYSSYKICARCGWGRNFFEVEVPENIREKIDVEARVMYCDPKGTRFGAFRDESKVAFSCPPTDEQIARLQHARKHNWEERKIDWVPKKAKPSGEYDIQNNGEDQEFVCARCGWGLIEFGSYYRDYEHSFTNHVLFDPQGNAYCSSEGIRGFGIWYHPIGHEILCPLNEEEMKKYFDESFKR